MRGSGLWGTRALLRLYPRAWRERYADEFLAVTEARRLRFADLFDIAVGAFDAHRHRLAGQGPRLAPLSLAASPPLTAMSAAPERSYGVVSSVPVGEMSRRTFMRRVLGVGAAILSLEFLGGTLAFLWPQFRTGLGATFEVGTVADIIAEQPSFAEGHPFSFSPARAFLVNVPAAKGLALGQPLSVPNPAAGDLLALWRKCPHLGCLIPDTCDSVQRYRCRCHGSTYNIIGEKLDKGPAERGMDRFAVEVREDGVILINTAEITQGAPARGEAALEFHDGAPYKATCSEL